jgi:5-methylcytosine-specific restriction enzyme subunit McrC
MTAVVALREYELAEEPLTAGQALALQASGVVDVQPTWSAGRYRLKAGAIVGALDLGEGLILRVLPKLEVRRVIYLLCHAAGLATWDDHLVDLDDDADIDVAVVEAFTTAAERTLRRGPRSSYYTLEDDLAEVRGRVDANRQRLRYGLPLPISVTFDEYGFDIPENQLVLGAALQLQRLPALPGALRRRLRRLVTSLEGVYPARRDQANTPVHFTRLNDTYRPAVALARAALEGVSFDLGSGRRSLTGFTANMNMLFERFLSVALADALAGHDGRLCVQRADYLDRDSQARIIPDLTWMRNHKPAVVVDAKYKDPSDRKPADDDLYQVVAYCAGLGIHRAFLVHATTATSATLLIESGGIEITVTGLDLAAPLGDLRERIAGLGEAVASAASSL